MCPKPNDTRNALSKKSHVEEIEGIPGLFRTLTEEPDIERRWSIFTFPVDFDAALYGSKFDMDTKVYLRKTFKINSLEFFLIKILLIHRFNGSAIRCISKRKTKYCNR